MIFQQLAEVFSAFSAGRLKAPANALRQCAAPSRCEIQLHNNSVVQIAIRISDLIQQIFQPFLLWQSVFHCILRQFLQFRLFNRADVTGAVGLLAEDRTQQPDPAQQKAVAVAAAFLAKQMEE